MGFKYFEVIKICLTRLGEGNADFSDKSKICDTDGIAVRVRKRHREF